MSGLAKDKRHVVLNMFMLIHAELLNVPISESFNHFLFVAVIVVFVFVHGFVVRLRTRSALEVVSFDGLEGSKQA